jgi:hypothetical protein
MLVIHRHYVCHYSRLALFSSFVAVPERRPRLAGAILFATTEACASVEGPSVLRTFALDEACALGDPRRLRAFGAGAEEDGCTLRGLPRGLPRLPKTGPGGASKSGMSKAARDIFN